MAECVQSLFLGERLSPIQQLCIRSFLHHGHRFHLYTYDPVAGVPDGAEVRSADEILPRKEAREPSDLLATSFQYRLLFERGGIWAGLDMACLRHVECPGDCWFGWQDDRLIGDALLRFPRRHGLLRLLISAIEAPNESQEWDSDDDLREKAYRRYRWPQRLEAQQHIDWAAFGPSNLTSQLRHFGFHWNALPQFTFFPIPSHERSRIFDGSIRLHDPRFARSNLIRLWHENSPELHPGEHPAFSSENLLADLTRKYESGPSPLRPL